MLYRSAMEGLTSTFSFNHLGRCSIVLGYRLHNGSERAARPTPRRPEVHQNGPLRLQHNLREISAVHFSNGLTHEFSPRVISSTMAFVIHPSATSSAPSRCISVKSF